MKMGKPTFNVSKKVFNIFLVIGFLILGILFYLTTSPLIKVTLGKYEITTGYIDKVDDVYSGEENLGTNHEVIYFNYTVDEKNYSNNQQSPYLMKRFKQCNAVNVQEDKSCQLKIYYSSDNIENGKIYRFNIVALIIEIACLLFGLTMFKYNMKRK